MHQAFNLSEKQRTVLIFDIIRPDSLPLGTTIKGHTDQLDDFIGMVSIKQCACLCKQALTACAFEAQKLARHTVFFPTPRTF